MHGHPGGHGLEHTSCRRLLRPEPQTCVPPAPPTGLSCTQGRDLFFSLLGDGPRGLNGRILGR